MRTEYMAVCDSCNEFTQLGIFRPDIDFFEGEWSILYNKYTNNGLLLSKFILKHCHHGIKFFENKTDEFAEWIRKGNRFWSDRIDSIVMDNIFKEEQLKKEKLNNQELGLSQLRVLIKYLEEEKTMISRIKADTSAEHQVLLGKEYGIKKSIEITNDLLNKWYKINKKEPF